jgi:DNA-binding MarR family transcriptional regulator
MEHRAGHNRLGGTSRRLDLTVAASHRTHWLVVSSLFVTIPARPAGLTAAWWQVLGAVLGESLPVAGIAREMGLARQSVQRVADILVARGLAEYRDNPAHRRAKLLAPTSEGRAAISRIGPAHAAAASRLAAVLGEEALAGAVTTLRALSAALEVVQAGPPISLLNPNERTGPT